MGLDPRVATYEETKKIDFVTETHFATENSRGTFRKSVGPKQCFAQKSKSKLPIHLSARLSILRRVRASELVLAIVIARHFKSKLKSRVGVEKVVAAHDARCENRPKLA